MAEKKKGPGVNAMEAAMAIYKRKAMARDAEAGAQRVPEGKTQASPPADKSDNKTNRGNSQDNMSKKAAEEFHKKRGR